MAFHDVLFPTTISLGAEGGPEFMTRVLSTGSGHEFRNVQWDTPRGRWNVAHGVKTRDEAFALREFFYERKGRAYPFRFKDWMDYEVEDQALGIGNGTQNIFFLYKVYGTGDTAYTRRIVLPVNPLTYADANPFVIKLNGTPVLAADYEVDWAKGIVTFDTAPTTGQVVSWSGDFHCVCRFDTDYFNPTLVEYDYIDWPDIPVIELRPEELLAENEL